MNEASYTNAQYMIGPNGQNVGIQCEINGVISFVPLDPRNADNAAIMALVAEGKLTIAPADKQ